MPYQAGLIEDLVENINVDGVGGIVLGVKEQSDAFSVARIKRKVIRPLRFHPGRPEGPWGTLEPFPLFGSLKRSHLFLPEGFTPAFDFAFCTAKGVKGPGPQ
jgi:hypothetical protein